MDDALSSTEATEQGESDYDSLEEYIYETDRDHEKEITKPMRLRKWQETQLHIIKNRLGTNAVEVVARSYLMGLSRLRDNNKEEVDKLTEVLTRFMEITGADPSIRTDIDNIHSRMDDYTVEIDEPGNSRLTDPYNFKVRESAVSEVENDYVQNTFFGPWVHRYVAALGFLDSEFVTRDTEERLSSFNASLENSIDNARNEIERMVKEFLSNSLSHWTTKGVDREIYDEWLEIAELLTGEEQEQCKKMLSLAEDLVEEEDTDQNE